MPVIDITGEIRDGMSGLPFPFPKFRLKPVPSPDWVEDKVWCEIFEGLHSQTGTYIETPAHYYGNDRCYLVNDIPVGRLVNIPAVILSFEPETFEISRKRTPITLEMVKNAAGAEDIMPGDAILLNTGFDIHWMESDFIDRSPYIKYETMEWLISKKPYILGSDFPRWENLDKLEGIFPIFYAADILMLGPLTNLRAAPSSRATLTVLPLKIPGTSCVPCRAILTE
ncbi:MAG: hypothetical protein GX633_03360 [Clostridiales bacterium]|nr:hypothetical protein [Clostridiales bacterium]